MLNPFSIEEQPSAIPHVINYVNVLCKKDIYSLINKISKDYNIVEAELVNLYNDEKVKYHLAGNIHYPPPQEIRCKARIRGRGFGKTQCKRKSCENGLCKRHLKQYMNCVEHKCERGINGLGACCGHKGLRLGFIHKPIPTTNDEGKTVVKWKKIPTYKVREEGKKIKKIKYTLKKIKKKETVEDKPQAKKLSTTYIYNEVYSLMKSMNLDDGNITVDIIFKRLQLILQRDLTKYTKFIENSIFEIFDKIVDDELEEDEDEEMMKKPILDEDLADTYFGGKKFLLHKESNEILDLHKNVVGHWLGGAPTFY